MQDYVKINRALISVTNKNGLEHFGHFLDSMGVEIISTEGTYKVLEKYGMHSKEVSEYTGQPEMLGGRVKTLHPVIHAGILAKNVEDLAEYQIQPIDMAVVNLYRFRGYVENIDVGGPTLIKAALKNRDRVAAVTHPIQYVRVMDEMKRNDGALGYATRLDFACEASELLAENETAIAYWHKKLSRNVKKA